MTRSDAEKICAQYHGQVDPAELMAILGECVENEGHPLPDEPILHDPTWTHYVPVEDQLVLANLSTARNCPQGKLIAEAVMLGIQELKKGLK